MQLLLELTLFNVEFPLQSLCSQLLHLLLDFYEILQVFFVMIWRFAYYFGFHFLLSCILFWFGLFFTFAKLVSATFFHLFGKLVSATPPTPFVRNFTGSCLDMKMCISFWIFDSLIFKRVITLFNLEFPFANLVSATPTFLDRFLWIFGGFSCTDMKMCICFWIFYPAIFDGVLALLDLIFVSCKSCLHFSSNFLDSFAILWVFFIWNEGLHVVWDFWYGLFWQRYSS